MKTTIMKLKLSYTWPHARFPPHPPPPPKKKKQTTTRTKHTKLYKPRTYKLDFAECKKQTTPYKSLAAMGVAGISFNQNICPPNTFHLIWKVQRTQLPVFLHRTATSPSMWRHKRSAPMWALKPIWSWYVMVYFSVLIQWYSLTHHQHKEHQNAAHTPLTPCHPITSPMSGL